MMPRAAETLLGRFLDACGFVRWGNNPVVPERRIRSRRWHRITVDRFGVCVEIFSRVHDVTASILIDLRPVEISFEVKTPFEAVK